MEAAVNAGSSLGEQETLILYSILNDDISSRRPSRLGSSNVAWRDGLNLWCSVVTMLSYSVLQPGSAHRMGL